MQMIRKKLQSRRGASITYALLLFLVCAVIGSVVLTAGTVAAGRMSQVAEMDQRYYSVNSAARLIIDVLTDEDSTVRVVKTDEGTEAKYTYYLKNSVSHEFEPVSESKTSFALDTAKQIMAKFKERDSAEEAAASGGGTSGGGTSGGGASGGGASTAPRAISIAAALEDATIKPSDMNIEVEETVSGDGGLLFKISNVVEAGAKNNGKYTLYVRFQTDKDELRELDNESGLETVTTTLKWKLGDVQIIRKPDTSTAPASETPTGG